MLEEGGPGQVTVSHDHALVLGVRYFLVDLIKKIILIMLFSEFMVGFIHNYLVVFKLLLHGKLI